MLLSLSSALPASAADPVIKVTNSTNSARVSQVSTNAPPASKEAELAAIVARVTANQTNGAPAAKTNLLTPPPVPAAAAAAVAPVAAPSGPAATNTITKSNSQPAFATPLDDTRKLAIGDRLSFRIAEDEEDPKPLVVTDSGELEVPYIGRVPAVDKTCKQLAAEIKALLEKDYYYEATVTLAVDLMAKTRGRIYLVGAVRGPGPQEILTDETLTLSKAILRSGGFADFADKKNVKITRQTGPRETDKQTFIVNVGQIYDQSKTELDVPLQPGDMILVPDRKIRF